MDTTTADLKRSHFQRLPETQALIDAARELPVGGVLAISDLIRLTGRNTVLSLRSICSGAVAALESEGVFLRFAPVTHKGLVRLSAKDVCDRTESKVIGVHRTTRKEIRRLAQVDVNDLTPAEIKKQLVLSAQLGLLTLAASANATKTIAKSTEEKPLAIGDTLKLFQ